MAAHCARLFCYSLDKLMVWNGSSCRDQPTLDANAKEITIVAVSYERRTCI